MVDGFLDGTFGAPACCLNGPPEGTRRTIPSRLSFVSRRGSQRCDASGAATTRMSEWFTDHSVNQCANSFAVARAGLDLPEFHFARPSLVHLTSEIGKN
jgi:hypothetical protein